MSSRATSITEVSPSSITALRYVALLAPTSRYSNAFRFVVSSSLFPLFLFPIKLLRHHSIHLLQNLFPTKISNRSSYLFSKRNRHWILMRIRAHAASPLSHLSYYTNSSVWKNWILDSMATLEYVYQIQKGKRQLSITVTNWHSEWVCHSLPLSWM